MAPQAIRVQGLCCRIEAREILKSLDFALASGTWTALVGPNGAGKSTLLRCLNRLRPLAKGTIEIGGKRMESLSQIELAKQLAYVPQADGRYLPFTVQEFVAMGRFPHLSPFSGIGESDRQAVSWAMGMTETDGLAGRMIGTLSGGERQKVFLAAVLAQQAPILLLDEPTTFLDPPHQTEILRILRSVNREQGKTILAITHDLNIAAAASDRILALKEGHLVFDGTPDELMTSQSLGMIYGKDFLFVSHPQTGRKMILPEAPGAL